MIPNQAKATSLQILRLQFIWNKGVLEHTYQILWHIQLEIHMDLWSATDIISGAIIWKIVKYQNSSSSNYDIGKFLLCKNQNWFFLI